MDNLLKKYNTTNMSELEARFTVNDRGSYQKLISTIKGHSTIEQSINFILPTKNDGNRICQVLFVDGQKKGTSFVKKNKLQYISNTDGVMTYKVAVSEELDIPKFSVNISEFVRIKLRLSVRPKEIENWRVDFTLVKTLNKIDETLKKHKENIFKHGITPDNFLETAPWDSVDSFELEVEHVGATKNIKSKDLINVVQYIFNLAGSDYKNMHEYQKTIYQIAQFIVPTKDREDFRQKKGLRDLYNRVWELNKQEYYNKVFPNIKKFYILGKTDGIRTMVLIENNTMQFLNGGLRTVILENSYKGKTICDVEHVVEHRDGKDVDSYYIFDVIAFQGENLAYTDTVNRVSYIDRVVEMSGSLIKKKTMISLTDNYKQEIEKLWHDEQNHGLYEVDGIIFTPKDGKYRYMRSWKWKPLEHMSIDFLVKKAPASLLGIHPYTVREGYTLMFLFSGISKKLYDKLQLRPLPKYKELFPGIRMYNNFPIQFSPSNAPYAYIYYHPNDSKFTLDEISNNVCEFRRLGVKDSVDEFKWDMMRIRTDRKTELFRGNYFGNGFYIAEYTWQNYENPLTFDDLVISSSEYMNRGYFQEEKSEMYRPVAAYNSYVKGKLLEPFRGSNWLVDLAAGKGQDMFRVSDAMIKNALFIDSDAHALSELVSRKHDFERGVSQLNTRIYTKLIDLKTPYEKITKQIQNISIPVGDIDVIMCNFAIHYLLGTADNLRNLIRLVSTLLKPGGVFFFTSFNGNTVFKTLGVEKSWDIREGEVLKYSIKKKYTSNALEPTGQAIDVLLPFSKGKYYEEFLVNYEYVFNEFKLNGFSLESKGNFKEYMEMFSRDVKKFANRLTKDDKKFLQLYGFMVLRKKGKSGVNYSFSKENIIKKTKEKIGNKYPYLDIFVKNFKGDSRPIETVDQITCKDLPYIKNSEIIKPSTHIGQRKLFLSEMQFLTKHPKNICVYAGSSPGHKTHFLSTLFPDVKFILIDPNKFKIKLPNGNSHRNEPHADIIHLYSHFETKSNSYNKFNNKQMRELTDSEHDEVLEFVKTSPYKIYIIEDYMGIREAAMFKRLGDFTFISDIRSNSSEDGYPPDSDIYWNMSMMYNWITIMSPIESCLKHRMPFGNDDQLNEIYEDDFKLSKQFGIDFKEDYQNRVARMCKATLYIQAWPGISSTEMRMHIKRDDITNIVEYDVRLIENQFFYYNNINRPWIYHINPNSDKLLGFCHCGDCALENKIITDYIENVDSSKRVKSIVEYLGNVTDRPLSKVHIFNIWENLIKNPEKFQEAFKYAERLYKNDREKKQKQTKYKTHRGDKGKMSPDTA